MIPELGQQGAVAISGYIFGMTLAIASVSSIDRLIIAIVISEIVAKYSMVLQAAYSNSAWEGYSSQFTINMKPIKKMTIASAVTVFLIVLISYTNLIVGFQILIIGIICCFIVIYISNRNFGGTSGDVMGATNEIVRLVSLISVT